MYSILSRMTPQILGKHYCVIIVFLIFPLYPLNFIFRVLGNLITCYMVSNSSIHMGKTEMVGVSVV